MADTRISDLPAVTAAAGANEFAVNEAGTSKKESLDQLAAYIFKRITGASGAAGNYVTVQNLTANSSDVTTSALSAAVISTTGVGVGTWKFKYTLIYQTAATGTGIGFGINHTGTVGLFISRWTHITTGIGTANGIGDNVAASVAGQLTEGKSGATVNAVIGSTSDGVAAANTNIMAVLEGIIVITATGTLEFKVSTDVAGSAVRIMADSCLELIKVE